MVYKKINTPRVVTQHWLDMAFEPIRVYLQKHYPEEAELIVEYLMFMGNEDNQFEYKNRITRDRIVLDQAGEMVFFGSEAIKYQFEEEWEDERKPLDDVSIHPNVSKWVESRMSRKELNQFGEEVSIFLQLLWGPRVNYNFSMLKIGSPTGRSRGCFCLRSTELGEPVAFTFVANDAKVDWYRENKTMLLGWKHIYLDRSILETSLPQLQRWLNSFVSVNNMRNM